MSSPVVAAFSFVPPTSPSSPAAFFQCARDVSRQLEADASSVLQCAAQSRRLSARVAVIVELLSHVRIAMTHVATFLACLDDCVSVVRLLCVNNGDADSAAHAQPDTDALSAVFVEHSRLLSDACAQMGLLLSSDSWAAQDAEDQQKDRAVLAQRQQLLVQLGDQWKDDGLSTGHQSALNTASLLWSRRTQELTENARALRSEMMVGTEAARPPPPATPAWPSPWPSSAVDFLSIPSRDLHVDLRSSLGKGGCGEVFRGRWLSCHQEVAVKRLLSRHALDEEAEMAFQLQFRKELTVLWTLKCAQYSIAFPRPVPRAASTNAVLCLPAGALPVW